MLKITMKYAIQDTFTLSKIEDFVLTIVVVTINAIALPQTRIGHVEIVEQIVATARNVEWEFVTHVTNGTSGKEELGYALRINFVY